MIIHLYSICFNEEIILPYYLRHYSKFVDKITIYDNMSTDNSVNIMNQFGVEVIPFNTNNEFCESKLTDMRNLCWKNSDADLVIVCDIDEFIYHPNILSELQTIINENYTIIIPSGYNMISETLPTTTDQIYNEITNGFVDDMYLKPCIFNPKKVNINFGVGSHQHTTYSSGDIKTKRTNTIKLLHYRHISREYEINKNLLLGNRTSKLSLDNGWGDYINRSTLYINNFYDKHIPISTKII